MNFQKLAFSVAWAGFEFLALNSRKGGKEFSIFSLAQERRPFSHFRLPGGTWRCQCSSLSQLRSGWQACYTTSIALRSLCYLWASRFVEMARLSCTSTAKPVGVAILSSLQTNTALSFKTCLMLARRSSCSSTESSKEDRILNCSVRNLPFASCQQEIELCSFPAGNLQLQEVDQSTFAGPILLGGSRRSGKEHQLGWPKPIPDNLAGMALNNYYSGYQIARGLMPSTGELCSALPHTPETQRSVFGRRQLACLSRISVPRKVWDLSRLVEAATLEGGFLLLCELCLLESGSSLQRSPLGLINQGKGYRQVPFPTLTL